jgi:tetratricopeptide (TPR) repeat protein
VNGYHGAESPPSEKGGDEIREGIRLLERAVALVPASWPAHWFIGKGHQALGDHERAYEAFGRAKGLCQTNADVPRELCLECLHLGRFAEAVEAARLAVRRERSDPGLQANLALALLLAGDVDEALGQAGQAAARNPEDQINRAFLTLIKDVKEGRRRQPATLAELEA